MRDMSLLVIACAAIASEQPSYAAGKIANCAISNDYEGTIFKGPCSFKADRDGSFEIKPVKGNYLIKPDSAGPGVLSVSLEIAHVGRGEVRGMTGDGVNSRWGAAKRSDSDRACWVGSDFRVCVR